MEENNIFNSEEQQEQITVETPKEPVDTTESEPVILEETEGTEVFEQEEKYYPPIVETSSAMEPDPVNKKGLRFFALILAFIIIFTAGTATGYFLNRTLIDKTVGVDLASKPKNTDMLTEAEVYAKVNDSIVGISVYNSTSASSASGVVYTKDGYIITNDHIYSEVSAAKFKVYMADGKEYDAVYVAGDTRSDLAVLKIKQSVSLTPATIGNSAELYLGEPVVAMGRPTGASTKNNITSGIVSLLDSRTSSTSNYSAKHIQTNAAINPGSSGGALLNMYGQVVGITSSKIAGAEYEGMGFAIPSVTVKKIVDSLIKNGYVADRAKLGISYYEVDSIAAEINKVTKGFCIAEISEGSDMYGKAAVGDTIVAVNGKEYAGADTILDVIENAKPGDTIILTISSKSGKKDINVKLLPDRGSSSYVEKETPKGNNSQPNTSEFTFPFGD
ncbi:MAG: trypsin-like peptidase domain-containing protein [Acutalibacteraceae bacterium]|nr:trypsin-like peptidase domain-containing protein [Acutalibacteraceae bacterium]